MTEPRRLAQLPGYDTAPDVYETPNAHAEGHEDSTVSSTGTARTGASSHVDDARSDTSHASDDDDDPAAGLSRLRIRPGEARSRFGELSAQVQAKSVDWSDRVDGRRRGYEVRRRRIYDGDEREEGLQERLARLKREIEECRADAASEKARRGEAEGEQGGDEGEEDIEALSTLLSAIEVPRPAIQRRTGAGLENPDAPPQERISTPTAHAKPPDEQALTRLAALDQRLASLETALGAPAIDSTADSSGGAAALLPTVALLDQQLSALNTAASLAGLDAMSGRIQALQADARALSSAAASSDGDADEDESSHANGKTATTLAATDLQALRSLYSLLPTLQSLTPTVPALIARLRSLRTLHGTAASAAADLDAIEQRQKELAQGLQTWRQGLEQVEQAIARADEANGRNGGMVKTWVDDIEKRVTALGR